MKFLKLTNTPFITHYEGNECVLDTDVTINIDFVMAFDYNGIPDTDDVTYHAEITLKEGLKCSGFPVPNFLRWLFPRWKKNDETYNILAFLLHELYVTKGYYLLSRLEVDTLTRLIVLSKISNPVVRFIVSSALEFFMASQLQWGDDNENESMIKMTMKADYD